MADVTKVCPLKNVKKTRMVERVVKEEQIYYENEPDYDNPVYTLKLSKKEAEALASLCRRVGGRPQGMRGIFSSHPESILEQLRAAGVKEHEPPTNAVVNRAIYFND